jgi:hypothetical protein
MIALLKKWLPVSWFDAVLMREFGITDKSRLSMLNRSNESDHISAIG